MTGKKIGYIRVSTKAQNPERQLADLNLDIVFTEHASGTSKTRPKLEEMLNYIRDEDIVYIHCMDRLARNLDDLRRIITVITDKKAQIKFVKEGLEFTGSKSPGQLHEIYDLQIILPQIHKFTSSNLSHA